jgi:hypothetical protein
MKICSPVFILFYVYRQTGSQVQVTLLLMVCQSVYLF